MNFSRSLFRCFCLSVCLAVVGCSTGCTSFSSPGYGEALKADAKAAASVARPSQATAPIAAENESYQHADTYHADTYRPGELEAIRRDYQSRINSFGSFGASESCGFG